MTICERLFEELKLRGFTAYSMSKSIGVSTATISNWKQRNTDPPSKCIIPICEFLGCSIEYLLTGEDTGAPVVIKKEPVPRISENGREMLALYEKLSERDQLLLLGRLQEMASPHAERLQGKEPEGRRTLRGRLIYFDFQTRKILEPEC